MASEPILRLTRDLPPLPYRHCFAILCDYTGTRLARIQRAIALVPIEVSVIFLQNITVNPLPLRRLADEAEQEDVGVLCAARVQLHLSDSIPHEILLRCAPKLSEVAIDAFASRQRLRIVAARLAVQRDRIR